MVLTVCVGSCCYSKGAQKVIDFIQENYPDINLKGAFCLGYCSKGVTIDYNGTIHHIASPEEIKNIIQVL